jgi:hypothetical protein
MRLREWGELDSARLFKSDLQMQTPVDMINWTGSGAGAWWWQQLSSVARCEGSSLRPERLLGNLVQGFGCFGAGGDPLADLEEELLLAGG